MPAGAPKARRSAEKYALSLGLRLAGSKPVNPAPTPSEIGDFKGLLLFFVWYSADFINIMFKT